MLDLLSAALEAVGVELRPQAVDLPTLFGRTQQGAFDVALTLYAGPGGTAPGADPDTLRTFLSSRIDGRLQGARGWVDEELEALAARQLVTGDAGGCWRACRRSSRATWRRSRSTTRRSRTSCAAAPSTAGT